MKQNIGTADKVIRLFIVGVIAILYLARQISGIPGMAFMALGVIMVATSYLSFCPLYLPFGLSTKKKSDAQ
jgi:hypothetical protein